MRFILAAMILAVIIGGTASAEEDVVWTCAYPGYGADRETVIRKFTQHGEVLKEEDGRDYNILQDNDVGLIAVRSFSFVAGPDKINEGLNLGAFVILIEKKTMRFRRGNVLMDTLDGAGTYGRCAR